MRGSHALLIQLSIQSLHDALDDELERKVLLFSKVELRGALELLLPSLQKSEGEAKDVELAPVEAPLLLIEVGVRLMIIVCLGIKHLFETE